MKKGIKSSVIAILMMVVLIFSSTVAVLANSGELRIIEQPTNGYANVGQIAATEVLAGGEGLKYTWFVKDVSAESFVKSSIKSNRYTVKMTESNAGRQLYCVITDANGDSLTTNTVVLNLPPEIQITKQPENVGAPNGAKVETTVAAEGIGLKYAWFVKDVEEEEFKKSSIAGSTYFFTMSEKIAGREAYCVITDKFGNKKTTDTVTFNVINIKITKQPEDVYVPLGTKVKTTVAAEGEGLKYRWYVKNIGDEEFKKSSIASAAYVFAMSEANSGRQAYCVITDKYGNSVTTQTVSFFNSELTIVEQPKNVGIPGGQIAKISVTARGQELQYQWFIKDPGDDEFSASDVTTSEYSVLMNEEISGREVYCEITDKVGNIVCTETVVIAISNGVKITKQPTSVYGEIGAIVKTTIQATGDGIKYQWFVKDTTSNTFKVSAIKAETYSFKLTEDNKDRQVYCIVTDKYGKSITSEIATFKKVTLKIVKQPYNTSGTIGKAIKTTISAEGEGLTYQWYVKDPGKTEFKKSSIKASTYSFALSATNNGRQVYCIVTDKYGYSVQSGIAVMGTNAGLKILKEPTDIKGPVGTALSAVVEAEGVGLKYQWYVKSMNSTSFVKSSFTTNTYTYRTDEHKADRQIYCVVTDNSGNSITTKTIMFSIAPALKITQQPTDIGGAVGTKVSTFVKAEGVGLKYKWYVKANGAQNFEVSPITSGTYNTTISEEINGSEVYCVVTDMFGTTQKTKTITINIYKYLITADLGAGKTQKIGVAPSGSYSLKTPVREGFTFKGWADANGNTFTGKETVNENINIKAVWEIQGTSTLDKLITLTANGADTIKITGNITVDKPIYISYNTKIYADGDYTIKRAPGYTGDIFVVGRDYDEISAIMKHRKAILTLGGGKGTLTIDGNRDNITATVVGSAVFVGDSATLNLYDGVVIKNNKKLGNERVFIYTTYCSVGSVEKVGGAAIVNIDSTVNIYGGIIENNEVCTEYTEIVTETGEIQNKEYNGCGGAIFNRGTMTIYGGIIRGNTSLRGGAIYNDRIVYLRAGTIEGNTTFSYGGAISSSSSGTTDLFIGTKQGESTAIIRNNHSVRAGGALYSSINSPIMIYGKTLIEGNTTDSSGAAIYTAGTLSIKGTTFRGNSTIYSGGAIYFHYPNLEYSERILSIDDCVFEENSGSLGGAITLSASNIVVEEKRGTKANINNSVFKNNIAFKNEGNIGNGGAIYVTRCAELNLTDCAFEGNTAATSGGGISIHSGAKVKIINTNYTGNQATSGAAVNISTGVTVTLDNIEFNQNKAVLNASGGGGHGGAIYMFVTEPEMHNLTFKNNIAENNGGAIYQNASDLVIGSDILFEGNSALGHGGAVYMTYQRLADNVLDGSTLTADNVLFKDNTASAGGAVSTRSECKVIFNDAQLINNTATGVGNNASGGGAVYVGYGKATFNNVTATGNSSAGYGGVVSSVSSPVTISGGNFEANFAPSGGVINAIVDSNVGISNATIKNNESTYDNVDYNANKAGGAVNISSGILTISNTVLDGNKSDYYGGTVAANNALVYINDNTVIKNSSGSTGAALYFRGRTVATLEDIELTNNTASYNGVIYAGNGTLTVKRVVANGNKGVNGGVFFTSGNAYVEVVNSSFTSNSATQGGVLYQTGSSVVTLRSNTMTSNSAKHGGAIYNITNALYINANTFTANTATSNGGAIYNYGGNITATENNTFESNSAAGHGGAIYNSYYVYEDSEERASGVINMSHGTFTGNTALAGGAVSIRTGCEATFNGTTFTGNSVEGYVDTNNGDGEGGGVVYVGYGTVNLNNVTAMGNTAGLGGVIDSMVGVVNITGGTYSENTAASGGAIYAIVKSTVNIKDAEFKNNESTDTTVEGKIGGGAININTGSLTATNTVFDGNKTAYYGGTINSQGATITINGNSVVKNSTGATGAALYFRDSTKATIENAAIENNTSSSNGVVYNNGGTLTVSNISATGNKAYNGGVFYLSGGTNTVTDSTFTANTASNSGGVVFVTSGAKLTATDSTFRSNKASTGGAVYAMGNAKADLNNCTFDANTGKGGSIHVTESANVTLNGGKVENHSTNNAIWTDSGTTTINGLLATNNSTSVIQARDTAVVNVNNSEFTNNTAANGSVIYAHGATVNLEGNTFKENTVTANGGAVYINGATVNATGENLFENNSATGHGGAVYITYITDEEGVRHGGVLNMQDGIFIGNTALAGGAVSIRTACEATFNGTTFTGNSVEGYVDTNNGDGEGGGVVYVGYGTVNLNNVTATGNTAGLGGVIDSMVGVVNITGGTYSENTAASGGVIYAYNNSEANIIGGSFENNSAASGGAIMATKNSTVTVNGAEFNANKSTDKNTGYDTSIGGGAINIEGGKLNIADSVLDGNSTGYYGGTILINGTETKINDETVIKNSIGGTGAALYFKGNTVATIENIVVENNTANRNGVIYSSGGKITVNDITATGNKSNSGMFFASGGTLTITNGTYTSNTATGNGGVLCLSGSAKATVIGSEFSGNKAAKGGAVYTMGNAKAELNNCTFDANTGTGGSIHVTESATVTLNGGVIENHTSTNAIWANSGTTNLNGVIAKDNTNGSGGVIYAEATAVVNVADSEFTNNSATHGAVIYAKDGEINLTGNTFKENTATSNGGAIYLNGTNAIGNGTNSFESNSAGGHGGAIYVSYFTDEEGVRHYGVLNMQDGNFTGNTALAGGAVSIRTGCEATFNGTTFTGNSVEGYVDTNNGDGEGGGVVYVGYGTVNLNNVTAMGNTAGLGGVIDSMVGVVNITGGTYSENTAASGGAIYAITKSTITIKDAEFKNNESTDTTVEGKIGGGAININTGSLTATNTVFDGNKTAYYGGAINAQNVTVTINGNSVVKNSTGATGAALYFRDSTKATIENAAIENNTSSSNGVVYNNGGTLTVSNISATGNKAYNGGVFYLSGGTNTVTDSTFTANTASNSGGVVFVTSGAKLTATDSTFRSNKASTGGAVYAMGNAKADLNNCTFDANTGKGGSVYVTESANVTLNGGKVENHSTNNAIWTDSGTTTINGLLATNNSTSVIQARDTAVVNVNNSEFTSNTAANGSVIYAHGSTINLEGNTFKENTVTSNGGAVYINGATVNATGENLFDNNSATGHGGAIYITYITDDEGVRHGGVLNMQDGIFTGNTALAGGAVSIRTACEATFNGTTFTGNSVEGYNNENDGDGEGGGVVYVGYGTVNLNNVTATGNTAGLGGVIDAVSGVVNITGGTYSENTAASGGAIYAITKSTITIKDAEFKNNESTDTTVEGKIGGGAININTGSLTATNTVFDGNKTAYYGGTINSQGATVTINGNSVVKNSTGATGAALYFRDSTKATIENAAIENNTSSSNGVVYNNGGTLTVSNISATGNKAYNGGVFYISGGTNTITGSTFTNNTAAFGGALYTVAKVTINGSTFESNSATSKGGAVYGTGNANVIVSDDSEFNTNTAPVGGAIYIDQGAKANVTGGTFNGNTATNGDGGAVHIADSSTDGTYATNLTLNTVTFKNNTASAKGGAISTDTASEDLVISATDCTFESNKALGAGGGAVEIQNANCASEVDPTEVKIVFVNCIFTKNTCKTTGAGIEIRSSSCAKVDGITATENKATGVGGVVYVTSNFSRFYLTGTVSISGNTASDNSFINLYNSGYTCPPKVYTTHSSSAEWYSLVKGNKSNVQFDLPELP